MKRTPHVIRLAILACALSHFGLQASGVTLLENGVARASIVLPDAANPIAVQAAKMLQTHLKQISGAERAIIGWRAPQ